MWSAAWVALRRAAWLICSIFAVACGGRISEDTAADAATDSREADTSIDTLIDEPPSIDADIVYDAHWTPRDVDTPPIDTSVPPDAPISTPYARQAVLMNGAPDLVGVLYCFGAFLVSDDPTMKDKPLATIGPFGRPDPAAPSESSRFMPLRWGEATSTRMNDAWQTALETFTVVAWTVPSNPLWSGKMCQDTWIEARSDRSRVRVISKGTIPKERSFVLAATGCREPSGCGGVARDFPFVVLANTPAPIIDGKPGIGVATIDFSRATAPAPRDLWLDPPEPTMWPLARSSNYGSTAPAMAVASFSFADTRLLLVAAGKSPCETSDGMPTDACPAWSPLLSAISTTTGPAPSPGTAFSLVWIGSPSIASGIGSLRAIWIRTE